MENSMNQRFEFDQVARLPLPGDNVAIATCRLEAGTKIRLPDGECTLDCTIMEGHRFAAQPIAAGEALLSWELPFGVALQDISPGMYVSNQSLLEALRDRRLDFSLPSAPNFKDRIEAYQVDEETFQPGTQVTQYEQTGTFQGYPRGARGAGTRNYIVVLGTSSRTASYARALAARLTTQVAAHDHIDGIVAVAHTEGGGTSSPNNKELLLRTLAGFMVHSNIGAVLAVDYGSEAVNNQALQAYMAQHNYPLDQVPHCFHSLKGGFQQQLLSGEEIIRGWLNQVNSSQRGTVPLAQLKLALQCGGSDAFSGVSGNPLASWVARELIRHGGIANLAETDELIGAEPYVLKNVSDLKTAKSFLHMVERFQQRAAWHGTSAEGNPSGGNKFRGLYNIVLKSIGAAMKRHPDVRLDYAIDYSEPMQQPGYYFMDSPGNDLESIAGQVAAGSNLIYFVTGNGSITNFPFVPTIKIVTTSQRHALLAEDMDVNAGAYQDGTPMDVLGKELFERTLRVATGERTLGEKAGHSQVSIWRDWPQNDDSQLERLLQAEEPQTAGLSVLTEDLAPCVSFTGIGTADQYATDQLGLVLPTSLCSGQVARMSAERLNHKTLGRDKGISRFTSLVHTEGCGMSGSAAELLYARTLVGYLTHPLVKTAVLLEHGCEKTHNDYLRNELLKRQIDPQRFGWASVQLDGGIDQVMDKVEELFKAQLATMNAPVYKEQGLDGLRLGLLGVGQVNQGVAAACAQLTRWLVNQGGTVVVPQNAALLQSLDYTDAVLVDGQANASLAHGQPLEEAGFYIMETPTDHWVENLTGLGATGVELMLAHVDEHPLQGHPLVPMLQFSAETAIQGLYQEDLDLALENDQDTWAQKLLDLLIETASRRYAPKLAGLDNTDFQITRGLLGISM